MLQVSTLLVSDRHSTLAIGADSNKIPRMRFRWIYVVALAFACSPKVPQVGFKWAERRATYPNGLRLVVIPDKNTNLVEVDVRYMVGSNQDPAGKAGLAHYVEHMMFQHHLWGPDKPATFAVLPQISVFFNAFTNWDTTHYMTRARAEDWRTLVRLEAARMAAGCDTIPDSEFARELDVVRNEIRQRGGRPESEILNILLREAYPEGHPYREPIGGDDMQLASITKQDVCEFMRKYYRPEHATLIIAGNVDPDEVNKEVDYAFGAIKIDGEPGKVDKVEMPKFQARRVTKELDVESSSVHVMWPMPPSYSDDGVAAQSLEFAVSAQIAQYAEDWGFAYSVDSGTIGGQHAPVLVVSIDMKPGSDVDEVLDYVWKAAGSAHKWFEGPMYDESIARQKGQYLIALEPLDVRTLVLGEIVQFQKLEFSGTGDLFIQELGKIGSVDGDDIRGFIKRTLKKNSALIVHIKAKAGAKSGSSRAKMSFNASSHGDGDRAPPEYDPAEANSPLPVPEADSALTQARRFQLDNGMRVVLLSAAAMPVVTLQLQFDVGAVHEPKGKEGLASAAARFLRPPQGMDAHMRLGLDFFGWADDDTTTFQARGLNVYLEQLIHISERMIKVGDYNQTGLERYRARFKEFSSRAAFREQQVFDRELAIAVYGPSHPYATKGAPTSESLGRIGRDVLADFKDKHYTAANATLIITGNFDVAAAEEHIRYYFGGWGKGHKDEPSTAPAEMGSSARYIGIIATDLPQVRCAIAYPGPPGIDAMYPTRQILSTMLFQRGMRIRTELGSTYGLRSGYRPAVGPGVYIIDGTIDAEKAGESLAVLRQMIQGLRDQDEDWVMDFVRARRMVLKNLLSESTVSTELASRLGQIATFDLNPDFYEKLVRFIAAMAPAAVKATIANELKPEREVVVCMGGREKVQATFQTALGPDATVKYVDINE